MLYFVAVWTGLLAIFLTVGCGWLHWLNGKVIARSGDRALTAIWLGLVIVAISMLGLAIFVPLSPLAGIAIAALWLLLALRSREVRAELRQWASWLSFKLLLGYGLCSIAVAAFISQPVTWIDAGQYHYGFIQWFAKYGITPGLALINPQFGFVSAWFAIAAPFDFAVFEGRVSPIMNGVVLLVAVIQMVIALKRIASRQALLGDWFSLLFLLTVCTLLFQARLLSDITVLTVSPSPDSAIALLTFAIAWSMLVVSTADIDPDRGTLSTDLIPLVLSVGAVSIKLTALPLLAIAAGFYLFNGLKQKISLGNCLRRLAIASALILSLLWPFLTAEVLVSGCPLYPSTVACFNLPWTLPVVATQTLAEATHGWGQWFDQPPSNVNRSLWLLYQWFMKGPSTKLITFLILASVCSVIYFLRVLQTEKQRIGGLYSLFWLAILAIVGTAFMMLKAPMFRFGMSYALLLPVLSISLLCHLKTRQKPGSLLTAHPVKALKKLEYSFLCVGTFWAISLSGSAYDDIGHRLLIAPPLPTVALEVQESNQITYFVSQDERRRCWATDLPCVFIVRPEVKLRNPEIGLEGGFILDNPL